MYVLLPDLLFAVCAVAVFFNGTILRHRLMSHRTIGRRPVLTSLSFERMWAGIWSATALLVTSFVMAASEAAAGPWAAATATLFAVVFSLIWLVSQRCVTFHTHHFSFVFRWESAGEVSLHVNVRGPVMLSHLIFGNRSRAKLVRQGMQEIRRALELSHQLPAQVSILTLASPWFGHGRHRSTLKKLGKMLSVIFPDVDIEPVSFKKTQLEGMLLLITPMGREWHRVAEGQGIEVVGYRAGRSVSA